MDKKLPKVFQNNIGDVRNNIRVFHEGKTDVELDKTDIKRIIEDIFESPNHVYKTSVTIKTFDETFDCELIGRTRNSLVTIDNKLINIETIKDIKIKGLK